MCTSSTPLHMYNNTTSNSPTLPFSQESNETSFHSILSQNIPELPQNSNKKKCISKKKVYHFFVLLGLFSCLSLLIYLSIHVSVYMKLSGGFESNVKIPSVGNFNLSLQAQEVLLNVSSQLNSNFTKLGSGSSEPPSEMWEQVYLEV